MYYVSSTQTVK